MKYQSFVNRFSRARIAVLGDLMLDVYLSGRVSRISPEAPVPVLQVEKRMPRLGGAANVMVNLANLGAKVLPFGIVGCDDAGRELRSLLEANGISGGMIALDDSRRTTEKRRIMAGGQQLLREDFEDVHPASEKIRRKMTAELSKAIGNDEIDAVIFEDYGKGLLAEWMLDELVKAARRHCVITALDPKPGSLRPVRGLTFIKPNRNEAFSMAGLADSRTDCKAEEDVSLAGAASALRKTWAPEYLLISLAAQGMALFSETDLKVIPTRAREVFDVSGAGDTVTAAFTLALAVGAEPVDAADLANHAAGVVVGKIGTSPITLKELKGALSAK